MTRLQSHRKKKFASQLVFVVVLVVAAVVFIFTIGFKFIINATLFLNQVANSSNSKKQTTQKDNILESFTPDAPPTATSSSKIIVTGNSMSFDSAEAYINHEKVKEFSIVGDSFSEELGDLKKGENTLYFIAKSKSSSTTKKSEVYTIIYKSEKPKLEVSEPQDNSKTSKQEIKISGKTDPETYIRINNQPIVVDAQGNFQTLFKLNDGENKIEIIAEDIVTNTEKKTLTVRYSKDE